MARVLLLKWPLSSCGVEKVVHVLVMRMLKKIFPLAIAGVGLLSACTTALPTGAVSVKVIQPIAQQRCKYQVAPARLETMDNLASLQGKLGRVVVFPGDIDADPQTLAAGLGFLAIDTQFIKSAGAFAASDYRTLLGASLYYAAEMGYKLHARLNPAADFLTVDPTFGSRSIFIVDAKRKDDATGPYVADNAEYFPQKRADGALLNYLISYPNDQVSELPLALNLGIMVHEYTHLVFHNLFYEPGFKRHSDVTDSSESELVLASIDEGLADYFGYLGAQDPAFFLCSFPGEDRDLAKPKNLTSEIRSSWTSGKNFDSHEGGAVFASINYEIGKKIGAEENGKLLSRLMVNFLTCADLQGAGGLKFTFEGVGHCHAALSGDRSGTIQAIYDQHLGGGT